jgi:hypothetical protein
LAADRLNLSRNRARTPRPLRTKRWPLRQQSRDVQVCSATIAPKERHGCHEILRRLHGSRGGVARRDDLVHVRCFSCCRPTRREQQSSRGVLQVTAGIEHHVTWNADLLIDCPQATAKRIHDFTAACTLSHAEQRVVVACERKPKQSPSSTHGDLPAVTPSCAAICDNR